MSALRNALCLIEIQWSAELTESCEKIMKQDIRNDFDVGKETIIREILEDEKISQYYMQIWEKRTESQRRSLCKSNSRPKLRRAIACASRDRRRGALA